MHIRQAYRKHSMKRPNSTVTIDGTASKNVHPDVVEIINDFKSNAVDKGVTVEVVNL